MAVCVVEEKNVRIMEGFLPTTISTKNTLYWSPHRNVNSMIQIFAIRQCPIGILPRVFHIA